MNANKVNKMNSEIRKWREKDPKGVLESLTNSGRRAIFIFYPFVF